MARVFGRCVVRRRIGRPMSFVYAARLNPSTFVVRFSSFDLRLRCPSILRTNDDFLLSVSLVLSAWNIKKRRGIYPEMLSDFSGRFIRS